MKDSRANHKAASPSFENALVLLALCCAAALFVIHFLPGDGHRNIISDSHAYIAMSEGHPVGVPFSTRLLQPLLAASVASLTGLPNTASFQLLTAVEILLSLLLLISVLRFRGATPLWQAALLIAFGCSLAVTFAYVPVMVDPLLLLLACLTLAALDRNYLLLALGFACLAALTKEYGVVLGLIWGLHAYRKGHRGLACAGALLPFLMLLGARLLMPVGATGGFSGWQGFIQAMFGYHLSLLTFRGTFDYFKIQYMFSWSVIWPVLLLSSSIVLYRLRKRRSLTIDQLSFAVALTCLPVLLLGDWGRAFLIFIPFTLAVAPAHPLAKDKQFALALIIGGMSTALARPFHGSVKPPYGFTNLMIGISIATSIVFLMRIGKSLLLNKDSQTADIEILTQSPTGDSNAHAVL